jgi:ferredoxin-like protein FixX
MGTFIEVSIDREACADGQGLEGLTGLCPVDIFVNTPDGVGILEDRVDECTLCGLCWEKLAGCVQVKKLY